MVYVTGDMHGDISRFKDPVFKKLKRDDILIVCGDFGFIWDDSKNEKKRLKELTKKKFTICFVDGTHENFELLNAYPVEDMFGGKVHKITDNIYHLCRGQIFKFGAFSYFVMGGGESPDIDIRFEENTWSKSELPSKEELVEGAQRLENAGLSVDYIITHEPSMKIKSFLKLKDGEGIHLNGLNSYFEQICKNCKFKHWYFGSLHLDKHVSSSQTAVYKAVIDVKTGEELTV